MVRDTKILFLMIPHITFFVNNSIKDVQKNAVVPSLLVDPILPVFKHQIVMMGSIGS